MIDTDDDDVLFVLSGQRLASHSACFCVSMFPCFHVSISPYLVCQEPWCPKSVNLANQARRAIPPFITTLVSISDITLPQPPNCPCEHPHWHIPWPPLSRSLDAEGWTYYSVLCSTCHAYWSSNPIFSSIAQDRGQRLFLHVIWHPYLLISAFTYVQSLKNYPSDQTTEDMMLIPWPYENTSSYLHNPYLFLLRFTLVSPSHYLACMHQVICTYPPYT